MTPYRFEVFQNTDTAYTLRLLDSTGKLIGDRSLERADIEAFIADVERRYRASHPLLAELGKQLYDWLDGPTERWLERLHQLNQPLILHIDVAEQLRHLPWELLYDGTQFLCTNPNLCFTPARRVIQRTDSAQPANRPLRVLFMATSPEGVAPVLSFEDEEKRILEATDKKPLELVVEESGSLSGLQEQIESVEAGYFDVFHLTGHADIKNGQPVFVMEDDLGFRYDADAAKLAKAFAGRWPRLLFLSGCRTGEAADQGRLPSLCEALVKAGAPTVLGWALPVGDQAASQAAAQLYERLATGTAIDEAVARTRRQLFEDKSRYWHLLRLYSDATPLVALVTPLKTKDRARIQSREAKSVFLDAGAKVEVCPRTLFIGRRRILQRCLRALKSFSHEEEVYREGVLLHGMGGLGKSSLAARLCDRLADYRRLVWVGRIDEIEFLKLSYKLNDANAAAELNKPEGSLQQRLIQMLEKYPHNALFIFDDFEQNIDLNHGAPCVNAKALAVISALLAAIRETASPCRVIITSRYTFPLSGPASLHAESLESLRGADLDKKLQQLGRFNDPKLDKTLKDRALELGAGNPRLLERLNTALSIAGLDHAALLEKLGQTQQEFREEIILEQLVAQQSPAGRRLLAAMTLYELPVPYTAVSAAAGEGNWQADLAQAERLGLVETGKVAEEKFYFVSNLLDTALSDVLSEDEQLAVIQRAAESLYQSWYSTVEVVREDQLLEIHRLALRAGNREIAVEIGERLAHRWADSSRYREAERLCNETLTLGTDHRILHPLARAEATLGKTDDALRHYEQAKASYPPIDEQTDQETIFDYAAIVHNLAGLLNQRGNIDHALQLWQQSLDLFDQIGDVQGKSATLHNMAHVFAQQGHIDHALQLWQQSLDLKEQIGDVQGKSATLHNMANVFAQRGDIDRALQLWQQSLDLEEQIGDVQGKSATLHEIAHVFAQQGHIDHALQLWQQSLDLSEQIGNVQGKAATLHAMANVFTQRGNIDHALQLWQQSLDLKEQIGDVKGKAATLHEIASVFAQQGQIDRALQLWQQSLDLSDQIGDVQGKAATLHEIASVFAQQGNIDHALQLWQQSLDLSDQIGDVQGKAATLHNMARVFAQRGNIDHALQLWQQSFDLSDQIGDVKGKAATLHEIARVFAQQGQIDRALQLWQQSLDFFDQIGNVQGKADTLHEMARVFAQQGQIDRALQLWQQSLDFFDQIGNVQGKAATLHNMAWLAQQQNDAKKAKSLYLQAAQILAQINAWPNLITVLGNLGTSDDGDTTAFLAQAFWLAMRVQTSLQDYLALNSALLQAVGPAADMAPLLATHAVFTVQTQGENHPQQQELLQQATALLGYCAHERQIPDQAAFDQWFQSERLNDPDYFIPALSNALEALVGPDEWLFDRDQVKP